MFVLLKISGGEGGLGDNISSFSYHLSKIFDLFLVEFKIEN